MGKVVYFLRTGSVTKLCLATDRTRAVIKHGPQLVLPLAVPVSTDAFQGWKQQVLHNTVMCCWSSTLSSWTKFVTQAFYLSQGIFFLFREPMCLNNEFKNTSSVKYHETFISHGMTSTSSTREKKYVWSHQTLLRIQHNIPGEVKRASSPAVRALMGKGNQESKFQISISILILFQSCCLGFPIPQQLLHLM